MLGTHKMLLILIHCAMITISQRQVHMRTFIAIGIKPSPSMGHDKILSCHKKPDGTTFGNIIKMANKFTGQISPYIVLR